ncbi:hypothetical protein [Bordetella phage vB_BbrM_PHB04]|uniref:Uncharacterized protein n=1 Tax=Bordetella phage vB_BbrM_PHB04 TaxID=2029657 RepID=A0A291L9W3_9CAUD|nr:hypothetical protein HOS14_gp024 [Bordetella phage vB_BbrM_PHB04]ATI15642.1 hypothetical protein [Bordetella phage vB_BbrM_PHB04]
MNPKRILSLLAALAMLHVVAPAHAADVSACYTIGNMDARAHCIAKARKEPGMCYSIKAADLRAQCLAETR